MENPPELKHSEADDVFIEGLKDEPSSPEPQDASPSLTSYLSKTQIFFICLGITLLILFSPNTITNWDSAYDLVRYKFRSAFRDEGFAPHERGGHTEEPIKAVTWTFCGSQGSECGFIRNYSNPNAGTAKIDLRRFSARAEKSKGVVFFSPGGPRGSGNTLVRDDGRLLQKYIGDEYDIISFDPRGIAGFLPKSNCFYDKSTYFKFKQNTVLEKSYSFPYNGTAEQIRQELLTQQREADAFYKIQFEICRKVVGEELKYMGTSTVVRDIDFMAKKLTGEDTPINFYGVSYGSVVGQYLVNMLPDRVGRVVIDGIVDAVSWAEEPAYKWPRSWLSSTEATYDRFVMGCSQADDCPLAKFKGEEPLKIKDRLESFINGLYYAPLPVIDPFGRGVVTMGRAREYLLAVLQSPRRWYLGALHFSQAMKGEGTFLWIYINQLTHVYSDLERPAVSCNDGPPSSVPPSSEEVVEELMYTYENVSRFAFAVVTTEPDGGCQFWPREAPPPERFQGPWNHTLKNPILVLSNFDDPVTPIASARKVVSLLGNSSRLLLQDAAAHCTLLSPSLCVMSHVQTFFNTGVLPPEGLVCKPDSSPFPNMSRGTAMKGDEKDRLETAIGLAEAFVNVRFDGDFSFDYGSERN